MAAPADAADYYVSATGDNTGPGTLAQPWQTIARINTTSFAPGDRIFFAGGQTFSGTIYLDATDASTAIHPIVIGSYGTGRATISVVSNNHAGFYAYNVAGLDIENLIFTGPGASVSNAGGIAFYADVAGNVKLDRIKINNVEASGFSFGITIGSWNGATGYKNVSITNSLVHDNAKAGLTTYAFTNVTNAHENVHVDNVDAYNQTGLAGFQDPTGSGIVIGGVNGGVVEHCAAWNNGALNTYHAGPVGIWTYNSNNIVIQYNEAYGNRTNRAAGGGDGGGFDIDGGVTNSVLQYNYAHDNDGAGFLLAQYGGAPAFSNNVIRYNISVNDGRKGGDGGINVWGHSNTYKVSNSVIHDNTVIMGPLAGSTQKGIYLSGRYAGLTVRNNTFISSGGVRQVQADGNPTTANALFQCNDYFPTGEESDPSTVALFTWGNVNYSSLAAFMAGQVGQELCSE
ncbi:MAG TPA: right-handed parallel beta-helix repeat-containing protein [Kofleriaceae bacterium]|nr:right-handed parallel beta-helix repeat-containing protein [Kofleriaceae bacterium]